MCCDTLLSDTVVLTPTFAKARLTILRVSLCFLDSTSFQWFEYRDSAPSHTALV